MASNSPELTDESSSNTIIYPISDEDESMTVITSNECITITSDEDEESELPAVDTKARSAAIHKLFPDAKPGTSTKPSSSKAPVRRQIFNTANKAINLSTYTEPVKKTPVFEKMIQSVKVHLPVDPYGCQIALMAKIITAIQKGQNCLLESPTGSGKTLALLCGALAWQLQERNNIGQSQAQKLYSDHPELSAVDGVVNFIASSPANGTPEKLFTRSGFGERSIYDKISPAKRPEPLQDSSFEGSPTEGLVSIHKKRRIASDTSNLTSDESTTFESPDPVTPPKNYPEPKAETPENVRKMCGLIDNLRLRTSMIINCSVPTIYYGARTHKQLQQVIKEFRRTAYCGQALMTILSSREYSCIREFDRNAWSSKNDMCRGCRSQVPVENKDKKESNCKYYNNRAAVSHKTLPPSFDLEELVAAGERSMACPYYAARAMAAAAQIVFCPYNYLIDPSIRSSMQINLSDNIVIIDEGHNIEDICRDAATFTFTQDSISSAIKELEKVAEYRYSTSEVTPYIDKLIKTLKNWDDWFVHQMPLLNKQAVNNNQESILNWQVKDFVGTLHNHNIGQAHYHEFRESADVFCQRLREDPRTLFGVTQNTGTLIESIGTAFGYLFRNSGQYMDDFKPILVRSTSGATSAQNWRRSYFENTRETESLSLRLICLNPGVIFEGLKSARCILLASGTLTPLISLHSELGTHFPLQISPNHVIPPSRVWIGTLSTCPNGTELKCTSSVTEQAHAQDALGRAVSRVCAVTPHGVLCFVPSYQLLNKLVKRWRDTGLWQELTSTKHVYMECKNVKDHNDIMEDYYKYVSTDKGALLFAVYRGKVSEGMDFKDHQARAVITIGVPFPNLHDLAVKEKINYNNKYSSSRNLLTGNEWLRVQAYRALNQAVGRCVRHRGDWGAVLLVDARFRQPHFTEHLSKWVRNFLGNNHHTFESLNNSSHGLESFMQSMTIQENEDLDLT